MVTLLCGLSAGLSLFYFLRYCGQEAKPLAGTTAKAGSVALLALAGGWAGVPALIWLGLAFGAVGDFLLAREGEPSFLAGMAAFAIGHLCYAAAFFPGLAPPWALLTLIALAASTEVWLAPHTGALRWPVRGYVLVICGMAALAAGQTNAVLRAGVVLFVLSDLLLAVQLFRTKGRLHKVLGHLVWPIYWAAQALILTAYLLAR
jgi:uncharacterized membrane protein YhhN